MADNVTVAGTPFATDDIGGFHYQRIKQAWGADGVAGDTSLANPLPVQQQGIAYTSTSGNIAAGATGTIGPAAIPTAGNVSFVVKNQVAANAWAGAPVIVFEQSDDNTSWSPLQVVRADTGAVASTWTLPAGAASSELIFEAAMESIGYVRARVTTGPTTNPITVVIASGSLPFSPIIAVLDRKDGANRTSVNLYAANVTASTSGTEAMVTITTSIGLAATGSGTTYAIPAGKTLRITGIRFQHIAGAATANSVNWRVRVNTGGAVTTASTPIVINTITRGAASTSAVATYDVPIGEGFEIPNTTGTTQIGVSQTPTWSTTALTFDLHIVGYLY